MAASLYLKEEDFPDTFLAVNRLADLIQARTSVRPSIRKLSAEMLYSEANNRIFQETQNQSADAD